MWRGSMMNRSEAQNSSDMTVVQVQEGAGADDVTTPISSFEPGDFQNICDRFYETTKSNIFYP